MSEHQEAAHWNVAEWHGKMLVDRNGERIGKLQDVYVDVENDEPQFGTVKEGFIGRHLTFVPLGRIQIDPDHLQVAVTAEQVKSALNVDMHADELSQADESALYHTSSSITPRPGSKANVGSRTADGAPRPRELRAPWSCPSRA